MTHFCTKFQNLTSNRSLDIAIEPDAQNVCMAAMLFEHSKIKSVNKSYLFFKMHYHTPFRDPELRGPAVAPTLQVRDCDIFL
jgi:hypothetical protein